MPKLKIINQIPEIPRNNEVPQKIIPLRVNRSAATQGCGSECGGLGGALGGMNYT